MYCLPSFLIVALAELTKFVSEVVLHGLTLILLGYFNIHTEASLSSLAQVVMAGYHASHWTVPSCVGPYESYKSWVFTASGRFLVIR